MRSPQSDLLQGLSENEAALVMATAEPVSLATGAVLFQLGGEAERLYLVVRGQIDLLIPIRIRDRDEDVLLEEKRPGETLGWSGLVPPHRFTLKATAPVDTELLAFPRKKLEELFAAEPAIGHAVTRNVAAVIGHRLQIFQAMWLREVQRMVETRHA
ncbi:MAG: cyclic nucleotide-binding domain-containing protein [Acidobacteria bacterium]|nr:cyclic nucleotide-binding domain-containing protein [Acidobacteriota bacterium]MCG3192093.1 hypothetical protein [Thermoanaerobaculia bacterium]MCK6683976.1 cyclic nucleotide-binding domain-containing protein [Thermoanaerobaculia bacterium]